MGAQHISMQYKCTTWLFMLQNPNTGCSSDHIPTVGDSALYQDRLSNIHMVAFDGNMCYVVIPQQVNLIRNVDVLQQQYE